MLIFQFPGNSKLHLVESPSELRRGGSVSDQKKKSSYSESFLKSKIKCTFVYKWCILKIFVFQMYFKEKY